MAKSKLVSQIPSIAVGVIAILVTIWLAFNVFKVQNFFQSPPNPVNNGSGTDSGTNTNSGSSETAPAPTTTNTTNTQPAPAPTTANGSTNGQTPDQRAIDLQNTLDFASGLDTGIPKTSKSVADLTTIANAGGTDYASVLARYQAAQQLKASPQNTATSAKEKAAAMTVEYVPSPNGNLTPDQINTILTNAKYNPPASSRAGIINVSLLRSVGKLPTTLTAEQVLGVAGVSRF